MEELDVFCEHLTRVTSDMLAESPLKALIQADDDERVFLTVFYPDEFSVVLELSSENALQSLTEIFPKILDFALNHYRDNFFSEESWEIFQSLPGRFEFLCQDGHELCYRLARWRVTERFGERFFKSIDLYEDALQIHMTGGNYLVNLKRFREDLEKQMGYMSHYIRKPLRNRYDRKP